MFCKNCGSQLAEDSKFCSNCGFKTEENISTVNSENTKKTIDNVNDVIKEETTTPVNKFVELYKKYSDKLFLGGFISAAFGVILFLGIVLVSLIGWGEVYLYDGYDFTATLTTISLIFMLLGFVVLGAVFVVDLRLKTINKLKNNTFKALSIALIAFCVGFSIWGFVNYANEQNRSSSSGGGSYGSSYNDYYSSGVDKRIGLSIKVDSIKKSGNYTYVYCSVTNVSSKYVATRYRYVKVKAQFKNSSGSIVDTDWTYAIDSTWLEPGETKTFYYMVQDTSVKSATLSFVD